MRLTYRNLLLCISPVVNVTAVRYGTSDTSRAEFVFVGLQNSELSLPVRLRTPACYPKMQLEVHSDAGPASEGVHRLHEEISALKECRPADKNYLPRNNSEGEVIDTLFLFFLVGAVLQQHAVDSFPSILSKYSTHSTPCSTLSCPLDERSAVSSLSAPRLTTLRMCFPSIKTLRPWNIGCVTPHHVDQPIVYHQLNHRIESILIAKAIGESRQSSVIKESSFGGHH